MQKLLKQNSNLLFCLQKHTVKHMDSRMLVLLFKGFAFISLNTNAVVLILCFVEQLQLIQTKSGIPGKL